MKSKLPVFLFALLFSFIGCSSIQDLDSPDYKDIRSQIFLGELGVYEKGLLQDDFQPVGNPELTQPLRLAKIERHFAKNDYKRYRKTFKGNIEEINDSVFNLRKPVFFELEIADKVKFIESINLSGDGGLLEYLIQTENNLAVTGIRIAFLETISREIQNATEVYLVDLNNLTYGLKLVNEDSKTKIIRFSEGNVLGFTFSSICWTVNNKGDYVIGALPLIDSGCPGKTRNKLKKLDEKDIFDKI